MTKRILTLLVAVLAMADGLFAQFKEGNWNTHAVFGSGVTTVLQSKSAVYFLVDNNLFRYDKATAGLSHLTKRNGMSDNGVGEIYYNHEMDVVTVVYANSNIDVVASDGTVSNIPSIADALLPASRAVNDVSFSGNIMYIATDFGYITYDIARRCVVESNVYYAEVRSAARVGNDVWLSTARGLVHAGVDDSHASLDKFAVADAAGSGLLRPVADNAFFLIADTNLRYVAVNVDNSLSSNTLMYASGIKLQQSADMVVAKSVASVALACFDNGGNIKLWNTLEDESAKALFSNMEADGMAWELNAKGVRSVKVTASGLADASEYAIPQAASFKRCRFLRYNAGIDGLYAMTGSADDLSSNFGIKGAINMLKNGSWSNITPSSVPGSTGKSLLDIYSPVFDPDDPNTMYFGTWFDGVYKISGSNVAAKYDWSNSLISKHANWACIVPALDFDKNKNLWVMSWYDDGIRAVVLPRDKQAATTTTAEDWISVNVDFTIQSSYRCMFVATKVSGIKVFDTGGYDAVLIVADDGGNPASGTVTQRKYTSFIDQDGNHFTATRHYFLFEDAKGMVWLGTSDGVISFDPATAFDDSFIVNRIKADNNGTTDYLLAREDVSCMAVDNRGDMWFGTLTSGVYHVSADGTKVLAHYTTANSMITTDRVLSIACRPTGAAVYIGTDSGLVEFVPGMTSGEADFSRVEVSPANVPAGYSGLVLIDKLVSGAIVTIADAGGNAVAVISADGGKALWNLCDKTGARVATGRYSVYASREGGDRGELVGKINVIR